MVHTLHRDASARTLKTIAILAMLIDHAVTAFVPSGTPAGMLLHIPGRIVAPIMCYFVAEGFFHTSSLYRYVRRMAVFAALSHFPYVWLFNLPWYKATSVMWGLVLGLLALAIATDNRLAPWLRLVGILACCVLATPADWNYIAVLWIVGFGMLRGSFKLQMGWFLLVGWLLVSVQVLRLGWYYSYQYAIVLAVPLLALYKGRSGAKSRWRYSFYLFYPAHLLALLGLRWLLVR